MTELAAFIEGISLIGPGLSGWTAAAPVLAGQAAYVAAPTQLPPLTVLPAAERRRAGRIVQIAIAAGLEATRHAQRDAATLPAVFSSAGADGDNCHAICETLATTLRQLSPTRFHNSVHNAAAGYWSIATGCMQASTALAAFERSFAAGLLEAATQCAADACAVLLVGYDVQACGALKTVTRSRGMLAAALVLAPQRGEHSVAALDASLRPGRAPAIELRSAAAQSLAHNAMADALPLLEALAAGGPRSLRMPLSTMLSLHTEIRLL